MHSVRNGTSTSESLPDMGSSGDGSENRLQSGPDSTSVYRRTAPAQIDVDRRRLEGYH